jgi:hypothetical protein
VSATSRGGLALLLTLAAASCGPDTSTPQGRCQAQAYEDPTVKELQMRSVGNTATARELAPALNDAMTNATNRCLRAQGLAPPGGVEKEQPKR